MSLKKISPRKPEVASKTMHCWKLSGGRFSPVNVGVVIEQELPLYVNGKHLATASITPTFKKEFVVGYLFGQGFIDSLAEIKSLKMTANEVQVILKNNRKTSSETGKTNYRIVSGGGRSAYSAQTRYLQIKSDLAISKDEIFRAMNALFKNALLYGETEGVHAAGIFTANASPVCIIEDIGRHNTIDKIIGYVLLKKIDCDHTFLASTGRMTLEMVTKICRAGIPIVVTKTAVTDQGLAIAEKCGLTVIGFVRDTGTRMHTDMDIRIIKEAGMKIYTGADRILCD